LMAADELGHDRAGQEVKNAMATVEDDVQSDASARASSLLAEIIEQKKTAQSQQTNQ